MLDAGSLMAFKLQASVLVERLVRSSLQELCNSTSAYVQRVTSLRNPEHTV